MNTAWAGKGGSDRRQPRDRHRLGAGDLLPPAKANDRATAIDLHAYVERLIMWRWSRLFSEASLHVRIRWKDQQRVPHARPVRRHRLPGRAAGVHALLEEAPGRLFRS